MCRDGGYATTVKQHMERFGRFRASGARTHRPSVDVLEEWEDYSGIFQ